MKIGITRNGQLVQTVEVNALSVGELGFAVIDRNVLPAECRVAFNKGEYLSLTISRDTLISLIKDNRDNRIQAIKLLRLYVDFGLIEAKMFCDAVWDGEIK